jgi:ribosomal-protein-alanine acetyltransferase
MLIRSATAADIPAMMAVERASVTAAHWPQHQYEAAFVDPVLRIPLVLEEDTKLLAFVIARAVGDEWELENIAVAGQARRRGLGSRLLGELLVRVRAGGGRAVFLEVRESNHAARALYEKWAFEACGRRLKYCRQPEEDAITYRLDLV